MNLTLTTAERRLRVILRAFIAEKSSNARSLSL